MAEIIYLGGNYMLENWIKPQIPEEEELGVTRQTFYRNFQDKYDLINWYFDKILIE